MNHWKFKLLAFASLALTANCGAPKGSHGSTPKTADAPPYAALFTEGRSWTFDTADVWQGEGEDSKSSGTLTCSTTQIQPLANAVVAKVECEGERHPLVGNPIANYYAKTEKGLWISRDPITDIAALKTANMALAASPVAYARKETFEEGDSEESVVHRNSEWCFNEVMVAGDVGTTEVCFDAALGFVSGTISFDGGSSEELTATLRK